MVERHYLITEPNGTEHDVTKEEYERRAPTSATGSQMRNWQNGPVRGRVHDIVPPPDAEELAEAAELAAEYRQWERETRGNGTI